jgi:hypothetical protein
MECDYCHRNEDELRNVFSSLLDYIDKKVHLSKDETDGIITKMDSIYGFSSWKPDKLSGMDKILLDMPIKLVFGDAFSFFVKKHPVLKNIQKYYYDKVETKLSKDNQLNELLKLYKQEPSKELIELEINKQTNPYIKMMEDIKEKSTIFYKVDNITRISFKLFGFNQETTQEIHDNFGRKLKNIILCPYCAYVFTDGKGLVKIIPDPKAIMHKPFCFNPKMIFDREPLCEYFGVAWSNLDIDLLKKNYREMVSEYHPDMVDNLGVLFHDLAEEKTKEITTNYERLQEFIKNKNANT